jgi:uncharacterized protein
MNEIPLNPIKHTLENSRVVKFAYLFGSQARGTTGPLSDVDIAVYIDNRLDLFSFRLHFLEEISRQFKGQSCDLVVLNNAPLVLQYEVIREGKVLKEDKPKRVQFETHVLRQYLDMAHFRSIHIASLKRRFSKEHHFGQ